MDKYKECLELMLKTRELKELMLLRKLPQGITADEVLSLENKSFTMANELLNEEVREVDFTNIKEKFGQALENLTTDAEKLRNSIELLSNIKIDSFATPVGRTVKTETGVTVELTKNINSEVNLYLSSIVDKNNLKELTIEDIRSCGSMGDYEQALLPFIQKVILKFKEINNIN